MHTPKPVTTNSDSHTAHFWKLFPAFFFLNFWLLHAPQNSALGKTSLENCVLVSIKAGQVHCL